MRHVFPQAQIKNYSPGKTANLIVKVDGKIIYEKKVNGKLDDAKAKQLVTQIDTLTKA